MEQTEIKLLDTHGMHKSAIIFRDASARFVYVCYHCGDIFNNINDTLQHIESHFQVVSVSVNQSTDNATESKSLIQYPYAELSAETVDIKIEIQNSETECDFSENFNSAEDQDKPTAINDKLSNRCKLCDLTYSSKFQLRAHVLLIHLGEDLKCLQCNKNFKTSLGLKNHLKMHIDQGDVDWRCITDGVHTPLHVNWSMYEEHISSSSDCEKVGEISGNRHVGSTLKEEGGTVRKKKKIQSTNVFNRPFKCHSCPQSWRYANELKNHLKIHTRDEIMRLFKCKKCDLYFRSVFDLRLHVLQVHFSLKTFRCNVCFCEFNLQEAVPFEDHLEVHFNDGVLWTDISQGIHHEAADLTAYEEIKSLTEEQYPCEFCTQRFYIKSNLDVHMKGVHASQRRLQCGRCDAVFTTPKYYFAHQLEHERVGAIISERDDNVLLANLNACIDERITHDEDENSKRPYRCLICNFQFEHQYEIRSHIRERHVYKMFPQPMKLKREYICDLCGLAMKSKAAVKNHLLIHTNTKSHPCTICGKKFRQNSDRRIHERQHTGEKPYQCHECGKRFISKGLLTAHKKSHDDSTYPCPICGRTFNLPSGYRKHIQTHRQDRAFQCTVCSKSFNTRIYLTKHMAIHANKQYKCRFCEVKFSTSDGQRQHERYKHHCAPMST